ncbi:KUP/HAK/KT family potassium transporter [Lactobacillus helveticus]|uniref:KUP/HAK/KT family potassium transporter n=1 Tax=Lactobacillus helveticus TaxID=1587 RepID=UPI00046D469C|nr:KUP/HAK/KT family potassium transporter [Lactobacillus helveticus]MBU5980136.1 KUP/HAK/KT family potassium transporter [Lactobacillus helveticus]MCT3413560.1 potassium transporter Kup [Lactobacillus helveticus]NRO07682.1 Low affinity potassium transport system protein kup [Lactobacillus helveticus]NRO19708.1 Low affinity potassium transport system protein kup [Lactobacillus helveticus]NRO32073.1 Low affinity potassium transport system protein kup [Lactobacillus helveticus]
MNTTSKRMSAAGLLIAIGIVYGDIGTSPLYVMKSIVEGNGGIGNVNRDFIIGSISLVLWTVTLLTTLQTVLIALKATNHGEGGIFALYTLVRKRAKWLVLPALIGGAAILADGTLTPAVTVTTAIEGLKGLRFGGSVPVSTQGMVITITVIILLVLFSIQKMGTSIIGKAFGPIMFIWFSFLGIMGVINMAGDWSIIQAINPVYAIKLLFSPYNKAGIFILGSIFLATTGAEALYSDVGHVGKKNIIGSWPFVFVCLSLNYFGQGVWILNNSNFRPADGGVLNPFYEMIPINIRLFAIILATIAAVIASQALITGSFTLVAEASGLKFLPRMNINYPSTEKGQIYIPYINKGICVATIAIVLYFQTSAHMEAAYGLSITISMLATTILLYEWLVIKKINPLWNWIFLILFGVLEIMFMISSLTKFTHGGYISLFITIVIGFIMYVWYYGNKVRDKRESRNAYVRLDEYTDMLTNLSHDEDYPTYATNLVYMANVKYNKFIKREILYSILDKRPKRAKAYWFVTVNVTNEPFTAEYAVNTYGTKNVINIQLYLGFKKQTSVNVYIRQIVHDLIADGTIEPQPQEYTTTPGRDVGDFSFVIVNDVISPQTQLVGYEKWLVEARVRLQNLSSNPASWFGLEYADTVIERVPLILGKPNPSYIKRIKPKDYSHAKTK